MFYMRIIGESLVVAFCSGYGAITIAEFLLKKLK